MYDADAIAMALLSQPVGNAGGNSYLYAVHNKETNKVVKTCIPQPVKVRKYEVDIKSLQQLLRENKSKSKLSNKQIAEYLNTPLTKVEHWFRTDNCFAIPDEDIWFKLKELLGITDNSFDDSIIEFEYRDGVYEKAERCYFDFGIAPTLTTLSSNEKIILTEIFQNPLTD